MSRSKYHAIPTVVDGILFASKAEARRYVELRALVSAGQIVGPIRCQPRYALIVNGYHVCDYVGDFEYVLPSGEVILEDVKGMRTPIYRLKRRLLKATGGLEVTEVGQNATRLKMKKI